MQIQDYVDAYTKMIKSNRYAAPKSTDIIDVDLEASSLPPFLPL